MFGYVPGLRTAGWPPTDEPQSDTGHLLFCRLTAIFNSSTSKPQIGSMTKKPPIFDEIARTLVHITLQGFHFRTTVILGSEQPRWISFGWNSAVVGTFQGSCNLSLHRLTKRRTRQGI
jgi:hypothetical protein